MAPGVAPQSSSRLYWTIVGLAFVVALVLIASANSRFQREFKRYFAPSAGPTGGLAQAGRVRLTIDFGNGTRRAFEGSVEAGMTVFSALRGSSSAGNFSIAVDPGGTVVDIAGVRADGGKHWQAYVNGVSADDLPGHIEIQSGDRIVLRYE